MDIFSEYIVGKRKTAADYAIITVIALAASAVSAIIFLYIMAYPNLGGILALLIAAAWWGAYKLMQKFSVEFEYILTNHELDIDKIISQSKRKRLCTINFQRIERSQSIHTPEFNNKDGLTVKDYAGDMAADCVYFVDYTEEAERIRVIFQPSRKILDGLKKANPRLVVLDSKDVQAERE